MTFFFLYYVEIFDSNTDLSIGSVMLENTTDQTLLLKDCDINSVSLDLELFYEQKLTLPDFVFCGDLTFASSKDGMIDKLGEPIEVLTNAGESAYIPASISLHFCLSSRGVRRYWSNPSFHRILSST